jgi:hypothetical protein
MKQFLHLPLNEPDLPDPRHPDRDALCTVGRLSWTEVTAWCAQPR